MNEQQARGPVPTAPSGTSSGTGPAAGGTRPVPAPPRAQAVAERAAHLPDHAVRLEDLDTLPLEERAAVLTGVHDDLTSVLRDAED